MTLNPLLTEQRSFQMIKSSEYTYSFFQSTIHLSRFHLIIDVDSPFSKIKEICDELILWKDIITFKINISSSDDRVLKYFKSTPDTYFEKKALFQYIRSVGFKTILAIVPILDQFPDFIINDLNEFISEYIVMGPNTYNRLPYNIKNQILEFEKPYISKIPSIYEQFTTIISTCKTLSTKDIYIDPDLIYAH